MALYRKYRPSTFAEVVGQEHVTAPLSTALDSGRINHAYLFSGPRGCGKTSSARILARSLNCVNGPTSQPCGVCPSCVALAPGGPGNMDVIELDAASHGGVDDTRELRDQAFFAPAESRYRVFIVDEAHMVTSQGFNALLKIVEEPPAHLIFIFATTEPEKVLPTIRSRTHHYPFRLLAPTVMRSLLERICARESVTVQDAVFPLVIRAGGGSPRDSLSVLDQLVAGAGEEGVVYDRALALLGVTDVALIDEAVDALAARDGAALFGAVEKVAEAGHDPRRFAIDLLDRLRDLIVLHAVPDACEKGLVGAPEDQQDRLRDEVGRIGLGSLTRYAEIVHTALGEMRGTTSPRLLLEVMCARMLLPGDDSSALIQRVEQLESAIASGATSSASSQGESASRSVSGTGTLLPPALQTVGPPRQETPPKFRRPSQQPAPSQPEQPQPERLRTDHADDSVPQRPAATDRAAPKNAITRDAAAGQRQPDQKGRDQSEITGTETVPLVAGSSEQHAEEVESPHDDSVESSPIPDVAAVRAVWSEVRAKVRERDKVVEVMLSSAVVRRIDGNTVVLAHDTPALVARLASARGATVIAGAMSDVFGGQWEATCEGPEPAAGSGGAAADPKGQAPRGARDNSKSGAPESTKPRPRYERPSQRANYSDGAGRAFEETDAGGAAEESAPLPPEPDEPYDAGPEPLSSPTTPERRVNPPAESKTLATEAEMMDQRDDPNVREEVRDPDEVAVELLTQHLGAKKIDSNWN